MDPPGPVPAPKGAPDPSALARSELARAADGFLTTQLLYVAAKLGVADALAEGPRTGPEIAAAVGADPDSLTRVLRGLALEEVLAEAGEGRFALTELGQWLRAEVPGSMRGGMLARGELYYRPATGMLAAVREGGTAFEQVYGDRFFEYLSRNPEQEAIFQGSMTGRSEDEAGHVVAAYDFGGLGRLVDVGGWPPTGSPTAASWWRATSSATSRPGPTPTCSRGCCTTGPTTTPAASWAPAARPCRPAAAC